MIPCVCRIKRCTTKKVYTQAKPINRKLNLLKCLACVGVFFHHVLFPGVTGAVLKHLSSFAVPVFCMISGYYAFDCGKTVIRRRFIKLLRIFWISLAWFLITGLADAALDHQAGPWLRQYVRWGAIPKTLCVCVIDFAFPLWYLVAMLETYALWYAVVRFGKERAALKALPVLLGLMIVFDFCWRMLKMNPDVSYNFVTGAMPWFLAGYWMHEGGSKAFREKSAPTLALIAAAGGIGFLLLAMRDHPLQIAMRIPYAFGLFALALKHPEQSICRPLEWMGEKLSLYFYLLHVPLSRMMRSACIRSGRVNVRGDVFRWLFPFAVMGVTVALSLVLYEIKRARQKV